MVKLQLKVWFFPVLWTGLLIPKQNQAEPSEIQMIPLLSVCRSGPCNRKKIENQTGPDRLGPDQWLQLHAFGIEKISPMNWLQPVSKATGCTCDTP